MEGVKNVGNILPIDGYEVVLQQSLSTDYTSTLIHLYQPLIGLESVSLYFTLLHDIDLQPTVRLQTHHTLMNQLNMALDKIYEARLKLEGIGLLKTYKNETDDHVYYIYELHAPFPPAEFFQDIMLSELLYRHIGKTKYNTLKEFYTQQKRQISGKNVTVSFGDVFQTFQPTESQVIQFQNRAKEVAPFPVEPIDFQLIKQGLERQMIPPHSVLTETNKRIITQLMTLYDLETYEIEKALQWALTDENTIDVEQLKAACHDLFQTKHNVTNVKLSTKKSKMSSSSTKRLTKEDRMIARLESISPKQLLEDLSSGHNASEQDMKIISEVMIEQGLPTPVMNVLIHYVLLQSNMKLSKPYMSKIASHWSRAGLQTAKEAMDFARNEINRRTNQRQSYSKQQKPKEVIPEWFKQQEKQKVKQPKEEKLTAEQEKEKREMLALLQRHAEK